MTALRSYGRAADRLRLLTLLDDAYENLRDAVDLTDRAELRAPLKAALAAIAEAHRRATT